MDITPTDKQQAAMQAFVDALVGEEPTDTDKSTAAHKRRLARRRVMDWLHNFRRLCMRDGVGRYLREGGRPVAADEIQRNPVAAAVRDAMGESNVIDLENLH